MAQAPGILLCQVTSVFSTMFKSPYVILIWFRIVYSWSRKKKASSLRLSSKTVDIYTLKYYSVVITMNY